MTVPLFLLPRGDAMADAAVRTKKPATSRRTPAGGAPTAPHTPEEASDSRIDVEHVTGMLLGTWADTRRHVREVIKDPTFWRVEGEPMPQHRDRVRAQLHALVDAGGSRRSFPEEYGGMNNNGANVAGFADLVLADPSLQIKSGVQWGLFGSAVYQLGTKKHWDQWLPGIIDLSIPGAFAMTETGHGSDVAAIGTTATYDAATEEFVIHTPFRGAWKDYLGNAAVDGIAATVFAQLITGGVNYGVHCFYVPLRDENGDFLPGIGGEDDGVKGGLNGIDNGRLHFHHVRVPRENLLNRYGDVAPDGAYTSDIPSPGRRFFTMLGALVQGRVSLDGAATTGTALAEYIAITYATSAASSTPAPEPPRSCCWTMASTSAVSCRASRRRTPSSSPTTSCCASSMPSSAAPATPRPIARIWRRSPQPSSRFPPGTPWRPSRSAVRRAAERGSSPRTGSSACTTTSTSTSPSRETTTSFCSSWESGSCPTTPHSSRGRMPRPLHASWSGRPPARSSTARACASSDRP